MVGRRQAAATAYPPNAGTLSKSARCPQTALFRAFHTRPQRLAAGCAAAFPVARLA